MRRLDVGQVEIGQPSFEVEFSLLWQATIPTMIGLIAGASITRIVEKAKEKDFEKREKMTNINKIKSIVVYRLNTY